MAKHSTAEITKILAKMITTGEYKSNDKLPSENQLVIKYGISRAITNKVFNNLKEMDLVYSKPHQGYFVAEYFAGITLPYHVKYNIDKWEVEETTISDHFIKFIEENNLPMEKEVLKKKMYSNKDLLLISEINWYKPTLLLNDIQKNYSLTDQLSDRGLLKNVTVISRFEKDKSLNNDLQMVEYKIFYGENEVLATSRNVISHKVWRTIKKERPL